MNNECKLFVVTHKQINRKLKDRTIIAVGESKKVLGYITDATENNISEKNKNYCELTALYWIWKNTNSSIIGLEHYRRFFISKYNKILTMTNIEKILLDKDLILPNPHFFHKQKSIYAEYKEAHYVSDLDEVMNIITNKYPEYIEAMNQALFNANEFYPYNMFIGKKKIMMDYFHWLFDILAEIEVKIDITNRDAYQSRVFGFLAERLFGIWIYHHREAFKIKHLEIVFLANDKSTVLWSSLKIRIVRLLKNLLFGWKKRRI